MEFFKNIVRSISDSGMAIKLYEEMSDFSALYRNSEQHIKEVMLENLGDFLSKIIEPLNTLTPDQKGQMGIEMTQGQWLTIKNGYSTNFTTKFADAFSRWVVGAFLISNNMVPSDKQAEVKSWTSYMVHEAVEYRASGRSPNVY